MFAFAKREATSSSLAALFYRPVLGCFFGRCFLGGRLFCGWRVDLLRIPLRLWLCSLKIVHRLLQRGEVHFQRLDLAISRIEFLLMVQRQLRDRLLKKLDIALQTTGTPFHRLLDGANLDTGNVLRMGDTGAKYNQRHNATTENKPADHRKPLFKMCRAVNLLGIAFHRRKLPHCDLNHALSLTDADGKGTGKRDRKWQRAKKGWPNSMVKESRRRTCRCRCCARTRAAPMSCRLPAASVTAPGAIMSPAERWRPPSSLGGE